MAESSDRDATIGTPRIPVNVNRLAHQSGYHGASGVDHFLGIDIPEPDKRELSSPYIMEELLEKPSFKRKYPLRAQIYSFINQTGSRFRTRFKEFLSEYTEQNPQFKYMAREAITKGWDRPQFILRDGRYAHKLVDAWGITQTDSDWVGEFYTNEPYTLDPDNILLSFEFPEPIAINWSENSVLEPNKYTILKDGTYFEWWKFYRGLLPEIWRSKDDITNNSNLNLARLNLAGHHTPLEYYYVWDASLASERT